MATIVGNDIAVYQGDVNYEVYKNNTHFLIIKSTEGVGFIDPKFSRNQSEARRVGIPLGYYHFARPDLNANAEIEANYFLSVLGELREGEVLILDYEPNWNGDAVTWCRKWLDRVYTVTNCKPLIYLNQSQVQSINWKPVVEGGYGLWIAAYTYDPNNNNFAKGAWAFAAMQQWTSSQQVPGITGNVDGNVFFGDVATFKKYGYKKPVPQPPVDPCANYKKEIETLNTQIVELRKTITQKEEEVKKANLKLESIKNDISAILDRL